MVLEIISLLYHWEYYKQTHSQTTAVTNATAQKQILLFVWVELHLEWWVLCSAYFTIKYRNKKCQSLFLSDFFLLFT